MSKPLWSEILDKGIFKKNCWNELVFPVNISYEKNIEEIFYHIYATAVSV